MHLKDGKRRFYVSNYVTKMLEIVRIFVIHHCDSLRYSYSPCYKEFEFRTLKFLITLYNKCFCFSIENKMSFLYSVVIFFKTVLFQETKLILKKIALLKICFVYKVCYYFLKNKRYLRCINCFYYF